MAGNGRETALEVLTACRKLEAWSDGTLKAACRRGGLDRRESAFAARLTYGVLQNAALLDFYLGQYCAQPVEKLEPFYHRVAGEFGQAFAQKLFFQNARAFWERFETSD